MNLGQLVTAVRVQGGVDTTTGPVSEQDIKDVLNQKHRRMVTKALWRRGQVSLGVTVVDQAEYAIPVDVASLEGLLVDGAPYSRIGQTELWQLKSGDGYWSGPGGVYSPDFTSTGTEQVELWPAPTEAGLALSALATLRPVDMTADSDSPIVPEEFHPALVDGAVGHFRTMLDERLDASPYFEQRFDTAVEELRRLKNSQTGGGNVSQIRVGGYQI